MKEIQPFVIWVNGVNKTAVYMALVCNSDNLFNQAVFYWAFYDKISGKPGNVIASGNIVMEGEDYDNWDSNDYAWNWATQKLGVTLAAGGLDTAGNLKK
jgi:hypothetical protein